MDISYNGVRFPFHRTVRSDEKTQRTDDGVDALYVERAYTVEGVLTPDVPGLVLPGETFARAVNRVQALLRIDRKVLVINWGGGVYLRCGPPPDDMKNGPIVEGVQLKNFAGTDSCTITFSVRCHTHPCADRSRFPQWIAHRWTERMAIDPTTWARTWTRTGTLHIRPGPLNADAFRGVVTPPIRDGFLRKKPPEYELASDGLGLRYSVSDDEQYAMPPPGAISAEGTCDVMANLGIYRHAEVTVRLVGPIAADKYRLLQTATVIAVQKLEDVGVPRDAKGVMPLLQAALRTQLWKNEVTVYFRAYIAPPSTEVPKAVRDIATGVLGVAAFAVSPLVGGLFGLWQLFGNEEGKPGDKPEEGKQPLPKTIDPPRGLTRKPWGYATAPPDPGTGGDGLFLLAAALQDPCLVPPQLPFVGGGGQLVSDPNGTGATGVKGRGELKGQPPAPGELKGDPDGPMGDREQVEPVPLPNGQRQEDSLRMMVAARPGYEWPAARLSVVDTASFGDVAESPPATLSALHLDCRFRQRVIEDEGYVGRTEQREGGLTHFIRVKAATVSLRLDWTSERVGEMPVAPPKGFGDTNFVFLKREYDPGNYETGEDGVTGVVRISGTDLYGVKDPSKAKIGMTIAPWVAELMGREAEPIFGSNGPVAFNPETGKPLSMDGFRQWRDEAGSGGTGELRTG